MSLEIKLQVFEGPLELLLHKIKKNKLDIYDIPIAQITDQYVEYVREMARNDLDLASEFLVIAAQLLMMKSRMLLPKPETQEDDIDVEAMKEELTARLLELKMFKFIAGELKGCSEEGQKRFFGHKSIPSNILKFRPKPDLDRLMYGMDTAVLNRAFIDALRRAADRVDPIRSRFKTIEAEKVDVAGRVSHVKTALKKSMEGKNNISFRGLLQKDDGVLSEIVTFLVLLEMMRSGYVTATQSAPKEDIFIFVKKDPESFGESGEFFQ